MADLAKSKPIVEKRRAESGGAKGHLGEGQTSAKPDFSLNCYREAGYWANVPGEIWNFSIGSYPVLKKWLSYRHRDDLGRPLTLDEVEYVQELVRRLRALLDLGGELDENYLAVTMMTAVSGDPQQQEDHR